MRIHHSLFAVLITLCAMTAFADEQAPVHMPTDAEQVAGLQKMCADSLEVIKTRQANKSLFERLGKRSKIEQLATKLLAAHTKNEKIGHMFAHVKKGVFVKNVTDFLVLGTGGKANYSGRDMASAHAHLKITNGDFLSAGGDVKAVMAGMKYGENEVQEVLCSLASFIPVVVQK